MVACCLHNARRLPTAKWWAAMVMADAFLSGQKGKIMTGCYGKNPFLLPLDYDKNYKRPAQQLRRSLPATKWIGCAPARNRLKTVLKLLPILVIRAIWTKWWLWVVAVRLQDLKRELEWDGENMRFTNISDSDEIRVVSDKFQIIDDFNILIPNTTPWMPNRQLKSINTRTGLVGWCKYGTVTFNL